MPYSTVPIVDQDGNVTKERVALNEIKKTIFEIKKTIFQKVKEQKWDHTWWDEEVELIDERIVKVRRVTRDGVFE